MGLLRGCIGARSGSALRSLVHVGPALRACFVSAQGVLRLLSGCSGVPGKIPGWIMKGFLGSREASSVLV